MYSSHDSLHIVTKLKLKYKFHEYLSSWSEVVTYGQMDRWEDRHDRANSCVSQFCKRA